MDNTSQLINIILAWEQGVASVEYFCEYTTDAPHIDFMVIVSTSIEKLRGAIPACCHLMTHFTSGAIICCQSKISQFEKTSLIAE